MEKIKEWFRRIKASFGTYKGSVKVNYEQNKAMVNDYLEQPKSERPKYTWHEKLLIGAFHVMMAIPFIIVGAIMELRDWLKRRKE